MVSNPNCPYGAGACPKVEFLEMEIDDMKTRQKAMASKLDKVYYVMCFVAGIVAVELGVVII